MQTISRKEWGARAPKYRYTNELSAKSTGHWNGPKITVGGKTTWDHSKCAGLVRGIQNFHMDGRGWSDIAYNFVECPHGYTFEGRGLNVINGANGTNSGNRTSHAVMVLAGEENPFPDAEKRGFRDCIRYISEHTKAPDAAIGHRDHKSTTCPGDERYRWIHRGMPLSSTPTQPNDSNEKDISMEAALLLIKMHYDNMRGGGRREYDVEVREPKGYQSWVQLLLETQDAGKPLSEITNACALLLLKNEGQK